MRVSTLAVPSRGTGLAAGEPESSHDGPRGRRVWRWAAGAVALAAVAAVVWSARGTAAPSARGTAAGPARGTAAGSARGTAAGPARGVGIGPARGALYRVLRTPGRSA